MMAQGLDSFILLTVARCKLNGRHLKWAVGKQNQFSFTSKWNYIKNGLNCVKIEIYRDNHSYITIITIKFKQLQRNDKLRIGFEGKLYGWIILSPIHENISSKAIA